MPTLIDLTGRRFGRLTVVARAGADRHGKPTWRCYCECGVVITTLGHSLRRGRVKSCGCLRRESSRLNGAAALAGTMKTSQRNRKPLRKDNAIPILQPGHPDLPPEPYSEWSARERREFGMAHPSVQWQLQKRVARGVSIADAAADIGMPLATVQRYLYNNPSFRAQLKKAREWAVTKA